MVSIYNIQHPVAAAGSRFDTPPLAEVVWKRDLSFSSAARFLHSFLGLAFRCFLPGLLHGSTRMYHNVYAGVGLTIFWLATKITPFQFLPWIAEAVSL